MVLVPHLQGISWDNDQCFAAGIETTSQMHPHLGIISPTTNYPEKYDWLLVGVYPHCIPIRAHYFHGFFNHKPVHVAIPNVFLGLKTMKIQKKNPRIEQQSHGFLVCKSSYPCYPSVQSTMVCWKIHHIVILENLEIRCPRSLAMFDPHDVP